ncbi:MAG TPA: hypothetical protein VK575_01565 [Gemmatimonadaceae bacterium]|nr:hypothetical protein [Gemmatimonadaceae bacterium]
MAAAAIDSRRPFLTEFWIIIPPGCAHVEWAERIAPRREFGGVAAAVAALPLVSGLLEAGVGDVNPSRSVCRARIEKQSLSSRDP